MAFKENLLEKIEIDKLSQKVIASLGGSDSGRRADMEAMKKLVEKAPYTHQKKRDLDLYIKDDDLKNVFVLDNDLKIYRTTPDDIALRKSPTIKEMISIRNAVKILNDADIVAYRKEDAVKRIHREAIDNLDLSYDRSDIDQIATDGIVSLESRDEDGVLETLTLFNELLGYVPAPKAFQFGSFYVYGDLGKTPSGETVFGSIIIYDSVHHTIKLVEEKIGTMEKEKIEHVFQIAAGKEKPTLEGAEVFRYLAQRVKV